MTLTDERSRRIAAMVGSLAQERGSIAPNYLGRFDRTRAHTLSAARRAGQYRVAAGPGPAIAQERFALNALVRRGTISASEADEFLGARYPGQRFSGGDFQDQNQILLEAEAAERAATLRGGSSVVRAALASQRAHGASALKGTDSAAGGDAPFRVPTLPENYEQERVQDALEGLAEETAQNIRALRANPPEFPAQSLDGAALKPGSVPAEALNAREVGKKLVSWPSAEEAIELDLVHSTAFDRYVRRAATGDTGPGRVWEVAEVRASTTARIGAGPARYRIVQPTQRFGVMSIRLPPDSNLNAQTTPGILIQYGIVVAKIPHYLGRPPERLLAVEAVGDAPASLRTIFTTGGNGSAWSNAGTDRDHYWLRTQAEHVTNGFPFMASFGDDATLAAGANDLRDFQGLSFQLVTGRDGGEVFRQLCSRFTLGRALRTDGRGPAMTLPAGLPIEAPTVPSVVDWQAGPPAYIHRIETYDLSTAGTRVVIGMPFSYSDCAALAPTDTHFSVVIQVVGEREVSQTTPPLTSFGQPDVWHKNGCKTAQSVTGRLRTWAVDVIVD